MAARCIVNVNLEKLQHASSIFPVNIYAHVLVHVMSVVVVSRITIGGGVVSSQVVLLRSIYSCTVSTILSPSLTLKMQHLYLSILDTLSLWCSSSFS